MSRIFTTVLSLFLVLTLSNVSFADGNPQEVKNRVRELAKQAKPAKLANQAMEGVEEVDLFQAIADEQIEVGILQPNMKGGKILVKNKTDKPLSVRMPKSFGTRPVMGQAMGGDQGQLLGGGGMGGMGGGMGGMGGMGGFQNIAPEKVVAVKYESVCLEYGKPEPTPRMVYEICPIEECTDKPEVIALVDMLGSVNHRSAQFAAWHLSSDVSIEHLATETVLHVNGVRTTNFTQQETAQAIQLIRMARSVTAQNALTPATSGTTESSSSVN